MQGHPATWVPFWPQTASNTGHAVDLIFIGLLVLCVTICALSYGLIIFFSVRYRRDSAADRTGRVQKTWHWEIGWTTATLLGFLVLFVIGAGTYIWLFQPPSGGEEIDVVGKQWMWKIQHVQGAREIDALHVPLGRTMRLVMTSQDVIHSFFIPAFRIKHDVLPDVYETMWFRATKLGTYRFYCSEYCGLDHADMRGEVTVMMPDDYERWLAAQPPEPSLARQGGTLFNQLGCGGCHGPNSTVHAPLLEGIYGKPVQLASGASAIADEQYIHDCITIPSTQRVAGYPPVMPSFKGQIGEEDVFKLVAYIKSLTTTPRPAQ